MSFATEHWLSEGGDARITLDATGRNAYGCPSRPDPALRAFGSSTASIISEAGFAAAERLRLRLFPNDVLAPAAYAEAMALVRAELLTLCGVADLPGVTALSAASGTDIHLIAALLLAKAEPSPLTILVAGAQESGCGVPLALAGRHFSTRAAMGVAVEKSQALDPTLCVSVTDVPIRDAEGAPRAAAEVDAEVAAGVLAAIAAGRRVLLVQVDVSKTGCLAPSPSCVAALMQRYPGQMTVLVDACQFRLAPASVRGYLEQGCLVALSGSKFLTGPAFSGALLIPPALAGRVRGAGPIAALQAYCARGDWPAEWALGAGLPERANPGLLLRWEAALVALRAFRQLPEGPVAAFVARFGQALAARFAGETCLVPLAVPPIVRPGAGASSWDTLPTIFPFLLRDPSGAWLSRDAMRQLWRALLCDPDASVRCQLGQPVDCGVRDGVPVSALRLCLSAPLIVEAMTAPGATRVLARAQQVVDAVLLRMHAEV